MADTILLKLTAAIALLSSTVSAHGYVQGIVADNVYYQGYRPSFQYLSSPPQIPGWSDPENINNGYINDYTSPDIICQLDATPGQAYAEVQAGGSVELQWTPFPNGHLGPVLTYLANCNGECTTVDKTKLLFNKIEQVGLVTPGSPGTWALNELVANNNSWTVQVPSDLAPGNYVLRHEIIALQEAMRIGGAQNYPQCVNLKVTGSGTNALQTGTLGTSLYTSTDPGIYINIYNGIDNYTIPGPPLISDASSPNQPISNSTVSLTTTATLSASTRSSSIPLSNTASTSFSTSSITISSSGSVVTVTVTASVTTSSSASTSSTSTSTLTPTSSVPLVFATISASTTSTITTSLESYPTSLQTLTALNSSVSLDVSTIFEGASTSTDVVIFTVTVPGVFAAPSTLTTMYSSPTAASTAGGAFYPIGNGTSWNGTAWSSGAAWPSGTAWSTGTALSRPAWTGYQASGTDESWPIMATETPTPIDNGYTFKRSMRIVRKEYQQRR